MDEQAITAVAAADDAYALPLAVMVRSALERLGGGKRLRLFILDGGLAESTQARLIRSWDNRQIDVHWLRPQIDDIADLDVSHHVSRATYYRILMPLVLPTDVSRAIYLDADLLVRADLGRLWDEPQGAACLAVADTAAPCLDAEASLPGYERCRQFLAQTTPIPNFRELGLPATARYFNAGVLVVDLNYWRRQALAEQMLRCLRQHRQHVRWWDQYALNVVLAGQWRELDPRWDQGSHAYTFPTWQESPFDEATFHALRADPWIVHFTAKAKPWHYFCRHPFQREYFHEVDQTAWRGWRPALPKENVLRQTWAYSFAPLRGWFKVHASRARRVAARLRRAA